MDYAAFRKAHPALRCYEHYTVEQQMTFSARSRGFMAGGAPSGAFYYVHPMLPKTAYRTAKAATTDAYAFWLAQQNPRIGHNGGPALAA